MQKTQRKTQQKKKRPANQSQGRNAKNDGSIVTRWLAEWGVTPSEAARITAWSVVLVLLAFAMVWALGAFYQVGYEAGVEWCSRGGGAAWS